MVIRLRPDDSVITEKIRIGHILDLIIRSAQPAHDSPGVLWIHGGGYILGMNEMVYMSRAMDLVRDLGAVVISPGYRLAWQKPYPAALMITGVAELISERI